MPAKKTPTALRIALSDPGLRPRMEIVAASTDPVAWLVANAGDYTRAVASPMFGDKLGGGTRYQRPLGTRDWESSVSFRDPKKAPQPGDSVREREIKIERTLRRDADSGSYVVQIKDGGKMFVSASSEGWVFQGYCG